MRRMRLRGMALKRHQEKSKGARSGSGIASLVGGVQEIVDESDEEREEEEQARLNALQLEKKKKDAEEDPEPVLLRLSWRRP